MLHKRLLNNFVRQLRKTLRERERERSWRIYFKDLANMVQTPLPFVLEKDRGSVNRKWRITLRKTYIYHSVGSVCWRWNTSHAYHLSRTRFTNQCSGKIEFDRSVKVAFQPKAYCDENIMKSWFFKISEKFLESLLRKLRYQPTNYYYQQQGSYTTLLTPVQKDSIFCKKVKSVLLIQRHILSSFKHPRWSFLVKTINSFKSLTIFAKVSILYVLQSSEYTFTKTFEVKRVFTKMINDFFILSFWRLLIFTYKPPRR